MSGTSCLRAALVSRAPSLTCLAVNPLRPFKVTARLRTFSISSPNMQWIPWVKPSNAEVFLRGDGTLGEDDPIQWPKLFDLDFPHLACIPLRDRNPLSVVSLSRDGYHEGNVQPVGAWDRDGATLMRLDPSFADIVSAAVSKLLERADMFITRHPPDTHPRLRELTRLACLAMTHTVHRSETFLNLHFLFGLTGRFVLEICGYLDYYLNYLPRMHQGMEPLVGDIVGVLVDVRSNWMACIAMGIPVWCLWTSTTVAKDFHGRYVDPTSYISRMRFSNSVQDDGCFRSFQPLGFLHSMRMSSLLAGMGAIAIKVFDCG